jgi:DHA2 family multidrug resistance protein-like MFS transporter
VLLVIYGLKLIAQDGLEWVPAIAIVTGVVVGAMFLQRQRTLADPLIDLQLFRIPAFSGSLAVYMLATLVAFGTYIFTGQYFQLVLGLSPLEAGLWTLPWSLAFIVGSNLTPLLVRRFTPVQVMASGLGLAVLGFILLTQVERDSGAVLVAGASVIYSLGMAPVFTLTTDIILGNAPPERAGSASAISETSSEFGGALGIAILGSIGTVIYRSRLAGSIPEGMPPNIAEAARGTLGGALAVVDQLPPPVGAEVLGTAREAFISALALIGGISAAVVALTAFVVVWALGGGRTSPERRLHTDLPQET